MKRRFKLLVIALTIARVRCDEPELPLCPTNIQYFPQNLPMHCRMPPGSKDSPLPPLRPGFFQGQSTDKQAIPLPFPAPPGMQGMPGPGPFPMPAPFPMPGPGAFPMPGPGGFPMPGPGPFPMPGPGTFPMPMSIPAPGPSHKLPVIVMPMYSPDPAFKKGKVKKRKTVVYKRPSRDSSGDKEVDTDTSSDISSPTDTSSEGRGWWKGSRGFRRSSGLSRGRHKSRRHRHNKQDLLTPILQYVTKDGYVIFEKTISKGEAKDWLRMRKDKNDPRRSEQGDNVEEPAPDFDLDGEMFDERKDKSKEQVELQTQRTPSRKRHKIASNKNHHKKDGEKEEIAT